MDEIYFCIEKQAYFMVLFYGSVRKGKLALSAPMRNGRVNRSILQNLKGNNILAGTNTYKTKHFHCCSFGIFSMDQNKQK